MYRIILKKNEDIRIKRGHSWVYANEVSKIEGEGKNGDIGEVFSFDGAFLGKGYVNHFSKILLRIISRNKDQIIDESFYRNRILKANALRTDMGFDDNYRVVFAEADNLPALIVDKYADTLSCQFLSLAMEKAKPEIIDALVSVFHPKSIFERNDVAVREKEGLTQNKGIIYGENNPVVTITENGIKLQIDLLRGQKTGYFLDQKENRLAIRRYAKNKNVLDCFSNVGGFALNCAVGGAATVTATDVSEYACDCIKQNALLNKLNINIVCADVFNLLREYEKQGKKFDLIILDPPAFCKSASEVQDAYRGYRDINILAMKLLCEGGILATCSCSQHMTISLFEKMLAESAYHTHRQVRYLERRSQSPDHPSLIGADETMYLKFYILSVI